MVRHIKNWVKDNCQMDDELVPLLNFEQMAIYFHGQPLYHQGWRFGLVLILFCRELRHQLQFAMSLSSMH